VVFCIDKLPEAFIPLDRVHRTDSLFKLMEEFSGKQVAYAVTYIEPVGYHDRIYEILKCDPDQSLLLLKQMRYTGEDEPVLYSANFFRSDVFSFHVLRKRMQGVSHISFGEVIVQIYHLDSAILFSSNIIFI